MKVILMATALVFSVMTINATNVDTDSNSVQLIAKKKSIPVDDEGPIKPPPSGGKNGGKGGKKGGKKHLA